MKLTLLQENLLKAIQDAFHFVPTKSQLPILSSFLLETKQQTLLISATDLRVGMQVSIPAEVEQEGSIVISAKLFAEYLSSLPAGKLLLEEKDQTLHLTSGRMKAAFQGGAVKDYPSFPQKDAGEKVVLLQKKLFCRLLSRGGVAASLDETRPAFSSILFESNGERVFCVSTDGYRLAKDSAPFTEWGIGKILLPAKTVRSIGKIIEHFPGETLEITLSERLGQVFFSLGALVFLVRTVDSAFPEYQVIIPQTFETTCCFEKDEFFGLLKTAMIFSGENAGIVQLHIKKEELSFTSASSSVGTHESSMSLKLLSGEEKDIAFNGRYVQDFLSISDKPVVWFGVNDSLKPGMFRIDGDEDFLYIVMPFRFQGK